MAAPLVTTMRARAAESEDGVEPAANACRRTSGVDGERRARMLERRPMVRWRTVRVRVLGQRLWQRASGTDVVADASEQML